MAAPVVAHSYAGPIAAPLAAPVAYAPHVASSYSTSVQHVAPGPAVVASYAAPAVVSHSYAAPLAAPLAAPVYAAKTLAGPVGYAGW